MGLLSVIRFIPRGVLDDATFHNIGMAGCGSRIMIKESSLPPEEAMVKRLRDAGLIGLTKPNHQIVGQGEPDDRGDLPDRG